MGSCGMCFQCGKPILEPGTKEYRLSLLYNEILLCNECQKMLYAYINKHPLSELLKNVNINNDIK